MSILWRKGIPQIGNPQIICTDADLPREPANSEVRIAGYLPGCNAETARHAKANQTLKPTPKGYLNFARKARP